MGIREDEEKLSELETIVPDSPVFIDLMEAARAKDPKKAMRAVLMECRGKPYFEDALGKAKVMLYLRQYYDQRK